MVAHSYQTAREQMEADTFSTRLTRALAEKEYHYSADLPRMLERHSPLLLAVLDPLCHSSYRFTGRHRTSYQYDFTVKQRSSLAKLVVADVIRGGLDPDYSSSLAHLCIDWVSLLTHSDQVGNAAALLFSPPTHLKIVAHRRPSCWVFCSIRRTPELVNWRS